MVKNEVNNNFLSYFWNPATPLSNQGLKNNKKNLYAKINFLKYKKT
jgi:hypothetical protein